MTLHDQIRTGQLEIIDERGVVRMTPTVGESDVVIDDGAVTFAVNQPPAASVGGDGPAGGPMDGATRLPLRVEADGTPSISLADGHDRTRLRFSPRDDGAGAIEFLDATGAVVHAIVPEHD